MDRRGMRRRKWLLGLSVAVAVALPVIPTANAPLVQAGTVPPVTLEFEFTGAAQTWTVPAGVTEATFDLLGAQGGSGNIEQGGDGNPGGPGGQATATLPVTAGSTVTIMVGGKGDDWVNDPTVCNTQGGFNGGGDAGAQELFEGFCGQGGGGGSDVRIGGTNVTDRVLVAGGGGGASVNLFCLTAGAGGGLEGQSAQCAGGGAGGNQAGTSGSGQLGLGSNGGPATNPSIGPGGGGGGGYYGGAGGATNGFGGGGGSGFGPAGTVFATGVQEGHGRITVSYDVPLAITADLVPSGGPVGTTVTITGRGFNPTPGATLVNFGPYPATEVSCSSTTQCTAVSPPTGSNDFESVELTVSTPGGPGTTSNALLYLYVPLGLALTEVSPTSGPAAGGTPVTFRGVAFETTPNGTLFFFGPIDEQHAATAVSCTSATECTGIAPPGTGTVTVTVFTLTGGEVAGPSFTYADGDPQPTTTTTTAAPTTSTSSTTSSSTSTSSTSSTSTTQVDASTTSTSSTTSAPSTSTASSTTVVGSTTDPATSTTAVGGGVSTTRVSGGQGTLPRTGASGTNTTLIVALALVVSGAVVLLVTHRRRRAS